jgi:hypothetical protein
MCLSLLAAGMSPAAIAAIIREEAPNYSWPSTPTGWVSCIQALVDAGWNWELLLAALSPHTSKHGPLTWPQVIHAIGCTLSGPDDRFEFVRILLLWHSNPMHMGPLEDCISALGHAGIHPMSLLMCSYPMLPTREIGGLMHTMGAEGSVFPYGCDMAPWEKGIEGWHWGVAEEEKLDGIVTSQPLGIFLHKIPPSGSHRRLAVGSQMLFGADTKILNSSEVTVIGDDIHVFGDLVIQNHGGLTHLGDRITVEGNLLISNCPRLGGLPGSLRVRGMVSVLTPCAGFTWGDGILESQRTSRLCLPGVRGMQVPEALQRLIWD